MMNSVNTSVVPLGLAMALGVTALGRAHVVSSHCLHVPVPFTFRSSCHRSKSAISHVYLEPRSY